MTKASTTAYAFTLVAALAAAGSVAQIYKWTDEDGNVHFGDKPADDFAQRALAELFPDREVVALNVDRIYENGGGIHCVTQQEPV